MSKFLDINEIVVDDEVVFVATLQDDMTFLGCRGTQRPTIEVFDTPQPLYGFQGDVRPETAEIIIRRQFVGGSSNDLGFKRTENGIKPIISEFDSNFYNAAWRDLLGQRYAEHKYENQMLDQGFSLTSKTTDNQGETTMEFAQIGGF